MSALRLATALALLLAMPGLSPAQGVGVTPDGQKGRIHLVRPGDTLWAISDTYLGTPWAWPSLWKENEGIENPHLIYPGDMIWIAEGMMRKLTPEEAERLLRGESIDGLGDEGAVEVEIPTPTVHVPIPEPSAPVLEPEPEAIDVIAPEDPFAALDQGVDGVERVFRVGDLHRYAFVTDLQLSGAGAIMGQHEPHYWASQQGRTIISVGEGQIHVGDTLTVFRTDHRVLHPETREILGYFVEVLGKVKVSEIHPEASFVTVLTSYAEIAPGDRVMPYIEIPAEFAEVHSEDYVEGLILAYQPYRLRGGMRDLVLLDVGTRDGVAPGRRFDIFRAGREVRDPATLNKVLVPDDVIGAVFVVRSSEKTSLAVVTRSRSSVLIGDHFRTRR